MAGLEPTEFQVLGLKVYAITPGTKLSINRLNSEFSKIIQNEAEERVREWQQQSLKFDDGTQNEDSISSLDLLRVSVVSEVELCLPR